MSAPFPRERGGPEAAAGVAFAAGLATLAAHVAAKATRDAIFLSHFPVTSLPRIVIASAVVSLGTAALTSRLLRRFPPVAVVPVAFGVSGVLFAGEWWLLQVRPALAAVALYLHFAALGAVLVSGLWTVANERFDPHTSKSVLARLGAFAALGGVVGGLGAERVSAYLGVPAMLLVLAGLHGVCALAVRSIGSGGGVHASEDDAFGDIRCFDC